MTVTKANPAHRSCIRTLVGEGGGVVGSIYHVRMGGLKGVLRFCQWIGLIPRNIRVIDLETEFHNGSFLGTTNAPAGQALSTGARIRMNYFKGWGLERLLDFHREAVAAYVVANDTQPVLHDSIATVIESHQRMNYLKAAHRASVGGLTKEELRAMGGALVTDRLIDEVYRQVKEPRR
jgi:hypothetical protein